MQVLIASDLELEHTALLTALSGLLKSANQESQKVVSQLIALPRAATVNELVNALEENATEATQKDVEIRYVRGVREVASFKELNATAVTTQLPWKNGGVYFISGGAGGLGLIMAREIATQVKDAKIVLTGRSRINTAKQAEITRCQSNNAHIEYRVLDVSDAHAVVLCVQSVVQQYGCLDGIVHSAGVIHDNFIINKTIEEFRAVLAPKLAGTVNLDRATQTINLDFFILFSSLAGALGSVGQSDYALANAFMDQYAIHRNTLTKESKCYGRTLSINWPLWMEGGMSVDMATLTAMRRKGFEAMKSTEGIEALYRAWQIEETRVTVLYGNPLRLRAWLLERTHAMSNHVARPVEMSPVSSLNGAMERSAAIDADSLLGKVRSALLSLIAVQLKMNVEKLSVDAELSEFGFDSISLTAFSNALNQAYGLELSPTIFFEYPTLSRFSEYLVKEHTAELADQLGVRPVAQVALPNAAMKRASVTTRGVEPFKRRRVNSFTLEKVTTGPAPIAIIGMSGCFPGAASLEAFWENLKAGKDCITEIPALRWDWRALYGDPAEGNQTKIKWGGFIAGVDEFDPLFFGISPKEAQFMDPQQRLLLTYSWKAIEDAGYAPSSLSGSHTGIFVGTASSGYSERIAQSTTPIEGYSATGAVASVGPNRMSYLLNLHGPSEPIETACSSSLVAIHRAVRALQVGDCEMALVGGINTLITPWAHISFSKAGMLSADGRCKTFSKDANGYVRGEGVGMLFLKPLAAAERDGDHIYGLIKGSAENHGGRASSLTAPNPLAQAELIKAAYREAQIDPRTVTYIETHGTGTPLGDPIEINGLKRAFADLYLDNGEGVVKDSHCGLGSVKTNLGHLELAAGVAGVIKVLLQLHHRMLAPSLHCEELNPYIQLQDSPFYIVKETQPWAAQHDSQHRALPRRAGISSFGFGGVNAHVILEEYCLPKEAASQTTALTDTHPALLVLSAKSARQLQEHAAQLLEYCQKQVDAESDLAAIAYTLQVGRDAMEHRLAFTAPSLNTVQEKLTAYLEGRVESGEVDECYRGEVKKNKDAFSTLTADAEFAETMTKWIERGKYAKLLELWVKGLVVDWSLLYRNGRPKRIALPTYPFAR
ncbi:MAG: SDR family NAD(P)-dependent oxidoreductase, partial [Candidatus Obscuribacterales bacterium]|nr:SDR family NAD(P)-dependent oxidoreductase [Steroidobacteraceae bacterium]